MLFVSLVSFLALQDSDLRGSATSLRPASIADQTHQLAAAEWLGDNTGEP